MKHVLVLALWLAAGVACESGVAPEPEPDPPGPLPTSCADSGGTSHTGYYSGHVKWAAADGPHRLAGTVEVVSLAIEAGALVCGGPGATLEVRNLVAVGEADAPIALTAQDPQAPWGGLVASTGGELLLERVLLEDAAVGIRPRASPAEVVVRTSVLRRFHGSALTSGLHAALVETVVDSACMGAPMCSAVNVAGRGYRLHFEDSEIRNSGGRGLSLSTVGSGPAVSLTLAGGAIVGSAGVGLHTSGHFAPALDLVRPIRITGGDDRPAEIHLVTAAALLASAADQALWTGNARDTVLVIEGFAGHAVDSLTIRPGLGWSIMATSSGSIRRLVFEPGASLELSGLLLARRVVGEGSETAPIDMVGGTTASLHVSAPVDGAEPSVLSHVRVTGVSIRVAVPGARLDRVRLDADGRRGPALTIAAGDVEVTGCEVTGSNREGILVTESAGVVIHHCDIHGNQGVGVANGADGAVDARDNWWGDPAGPLGPAGDGVDGNVLFEPWRVEPAWLEARTPAAR